MVLNKSICASCLILLIAFVRTVITEDAYEVLIRANEQGLETVHNDTDRRIIEFWKDAGRVNDDEIEKCCAGYVLFLQDRIRSDIQSTQMSNVQRLYDFGEFELLLECGTRLTGTATDFLRSINQEQVRRLEATVREFDLWLSREADGNFLFVAEGMMYLLGFDMCLNRADFLSAWNQGPCPTVLRQANESYALPLMDYASMVAETGIHPDDIGYDVSPYTILAVSIIRYCKHFRSEEALIEAWGALQTSEPYQRIRSEYATLRNDLDRN